MVKSVNGLNQLNRRVLAFDTGDGRVLLVDPMAVFPHMSPRFAQLSCEAVIQAHQNGPLLTSGATNQ
jgi:hypothetical protein